MMRPSSIPILICAEAGAWEKKLFAGDEAAEWAAMQRAGGAVGAAVLQDFLEIGGFSRRPATSSSWSGKATTAAMPCSPRNLSWKKIRRPGPA